MKITLLTLSFFVASLCKGKKNVSVDTLYMKYKATLCLDNGFALPSFSIDGDIYLTKDLFIFHCKPYHGKRYCMYNDLIKDILLPYDSIIKACKYGGLKVKTRQKTYQIVVASNLKELFGEKRTIVSIINQQKKQRLP